MERRVGSVEMEGNHPETSCHVAETRGRALGDEGVKAVSYGVGSPRPCNILPLPQGARHRARPAFPNAASHRRPAGRPCGVGCRVRVCPHCPERWDNTCLLLLSKAHLPTRNFPLRQSLLSRPPQSPLYVSLTADFLSIYPQFIFFSPELLSQCHFPIHSNAV